jgi:hypothetical protein
MTILVEDSQRNTLVSWSKSAVTNGVATGTILSPFSSRRVTSGYGGLALTNAGLLLKAGVDVWLDPETHALQMPGVGDYRFYDEWDLWSGTRGTLDTDAEMRDHVERVFREQDRFKSPHLAPTILLEAPSNSTSEQALRLAEIAVEIDPDCYLAIAGHQSFWASSRALDAHIGALAQLEPQGWWLSVARQTTDLPTAAIENEVFGLCRTSRSLSEYATVHISHGDMAALPAVAAGARSVGTGWDPRQRVLAFSSYEERDDDSDGGQWFQKRTLEGLLSLLGRRDTQLLTQQHPQLAQALLPGSAPLDVERSFLHHARILNRVVDDLSAAASPRDAYLDLVSRYEQAQKQWPKVVSAVGTASQAAGWITPMLRGLKRYGAEEGF